MCAGGCSEGMFLNAACAVASANDCEECEPGTYAEAVNSDPSCKVLVQKSNRALLVF